MKTETRILIVEDERIIAMDLNARLTDLGYIVAGMAVSGLEAIAKATELSPDLVLMDIIIKGDMDGIETATRIQAQSDIPIIYLTAHSDEATLQRAQITAPYGYLLKPFEDRELRTAIEMGLYRHQMERKLRESEQWLATTLRCIGDAVIATDAKGRIRFMNPVAEALTGWTQAEAVGLDATTVFDIVNETTHAPVESPINKALNEGVTSTLANHTSLIAKDGRWIPIDDSAAPIRQEDGSICGVVLVFRDITERKRAEQALRQSHHHLTRAQQVGHLGSWDWDTHRQSLTWTDELYRIFGVDRSLELTYAAIEALLHPEDRPQNTEVVQRLLSGTTLQAQYQFRIIRPDGEIRHLEQRIEATRNPFGAVSRMFGIIHDITERKRAEVGLRESERLLGETQALAKIGGWEYSVSDRRFTWTNELCRIHAVAPGDEPMSLVRILRFYSPADQETLGKALLNAANQGQPCELEAQIIAADGECKWVHWTGKPVSRDGKIVTVVGNVVDITERKAAEERLAEMMRDLARSNADLERFAYVAAHDLQEPLRMVISFLDLLSDDYGPQLDANAREFIGFAVDGAKRMQHLIQDLLDYSRVGTHGESPLLTEANDALAEALWNLNLAITDAGAIVTHDSLPPVMADSAQLVQLFVNLVGNAIKFRGIAPPRVHISAQQICSALDDTKTGATANDGREPRTLGLSLVPPSMPMWRFSVRDNGIGIDPKDHDRIFGIFQRLHTREEYPGTGIGLAVCRRIVERHGGLIWVESQVGQGTTFYFTLPVA